MTNITYSELVSKIENSTLTPNEEYLITDYKTSVNELDSNITVDVSDFLIVVKAYDSSTLYFDCKIVEEDGTATEYTAMWDYNTSYYSWGAGTGVINYLMDGNGNEAYYDFVNIKYNGKYLFGGEINKHTELFNNRVYKPKDYDTLFITDLHIDGNNNSVLCTTTGTITGDNNVIDGTDLIVTGNNNTLKECYDFTLVGESNNVKNSTGVVYGQWNEIENSDVTIRSTSIDGITGNKISNSTIYVDDATNSVFDNCTLTASYSQIEETTIINSNDIYVGGALYKTLVTDCNNLTTYYSQSCTFQGLTDFYNEKTYLFNSNFSDSYDISVTCGGIIGLINVSNGCNDLNINNYFVETFKPGQGTEWKVTDVYKVDNTIYVNDINNQLYKYKNNTEYVIDENQFVKDAPLDGEVYGRQNGSWVKISTGEVGKVIYENEDNVNFTITTDEELGAYNDIYYYNEDNDVIRSYTRIPYVVGRTYTSYLETVNSTFKINSINTLTTTDCYIYKIVSYGTVQRSAYNITVNNPTDCTIIAPTSAIEGDTVTLSYSITPGYDFNYFTVNGTKITGYSFVMPSNDVTISANVTESTIYITNVTGYPSSQIIALNVGSQVSGSFQITPVNYTESFSLTLSDTSVGTLTQGAGTTAGSYNYSITQLKGGSTTMTFKSTNVEKSATFQFKQMYKVTVSVSPTAGGTASVKSDYYTSGQRVAVTVTPNSGYEFNYMTVNRTKITNKQFIMPAQDTAVVVYFKKISYTITVTQSTGGTISSNKTTASVGDTVTLTATASSGYTFSSWVVKTTSGSTVTVSNNSFTMPASNVVVSATFVEAPVEGLFSVSPTKKVTFSKGNLQYTQSTDTWSFAENQYDMIGLANIAGTGSDDYDQTYGWSRSGTKLGSVLDLFGWSADNETAKWGISTSISSSDYSGDFVDWGKNIGDGNTYRTLTYNEWNYLLNTRTNASDKMGVARIKLNEGGGSFANGLILLPDNWTAPADVEFKSGFASDYTVQAYAAYQTFTLADWKKLEYKGAVFLPASGSRYSTSMRYKASQGNYWSATADGSDYAYYLLIKSNQQTILNPFYTRSQGLAVRLVKDV